jgi:hypothetical protein
MPMVSELREVIGALQSEVEFEATVSELGAGGIDRARISFVALGGDRSVLCGRRRLRHQAAAPRRDWLERRPAAGSHACDLARGHRRVVRRRRCRLGSCGRSGRAGSASGVGYRGWCGRADSLVRAATRSPRARVGREPDPQRRHRVDRPPRQCRTVRGRATAIMRRHCVADVFATPSA